MTLAQLARALERIESRMDRRLRSRLAYDLYARSTGGISGTLLGFLDHLRLQQAAASDALRPDIQLMEAQTRLLLEQVRKEVQNLTPDERKVVELHFYRGLAAPQVAIAMGLPGARRVYTILDRALDALRHAISPGPAATRRWHRCLPRDGGNLIERKK
jgi:DNA-directed RNA polymerase specialized sigma24 family protein